MIYIIPIFSDCYVNDNLETFNNLSSAFEGCIGIHKDSPCDSCLLEYKNLNSFYLEMDDHNNGQVCFDIQDSVGIKYNNNNYFN